MLCIVSYCLCLYSDGVVLAVAVACTFSVCIRLDFWRVRRVTRRVGARQAILLQMDSHVGLIFPELREM